LGLPSTASGQNCTPKITQNGEQGYDPATKTLSFAVGVHFICGEIEVFADLLTLNDKTVTASGNVLVTQEEVSPTGEHQNVLRINADRIELDRQTKLGTFYHAYGTARITDPDKKSIHGTQEPDIMFQAEKIEKLGPKKYRLTNGAFTTCLQPNPRWRMIGGSGMVELGDHATLTNVRFMVKSVPVLYVPYLYYPLTKDRASGFLIPSYSSSSIRGNGIANAYFLVLGKSQDATFYHEYYTKAGQAGAAEYRFAATGGYGNFRFRTFHEAEQFGPDGSVERFAHTSYNFDGAISQSLGRGFTLNGNSTYFTDITAQQRYQQNVLASSIPRRNISVEVRGPIKLGPAASLAPTLNIRGFYKRDEIFSGTQSSLQGFAPKVTMQLYDNVLKCQGDHRNYLCKVSYQINGESAYLQSRPFGPTDQSATETTVRRFDALSTIRAPLSNLSYLSVTTQAYWRLTEYLDSRDPLTGVVGPAALTRNLFDLQADVIGPRLERVFQTPGSRLAQGFQHVIEPRVTVDWLSPFEQANRIFVIDQIDQAPAGTTRVAYSLTNRVIVKPNGPDGSVNKREFLSVGIGQSYYSNAQAQSVDPNNPIAGAGTLSPVQISVTFVPSSRVSGRFNVYKNTLAWPKPGLPQPNVQMNGSASVNLNHDRLVLSGGWSKTIYYTAAQGFVDLAPVHALNATTSVNAKDGRIGATYGFNFDVIQQKLLQQRVTVYYHAQCCGIAFDYQAYSTVSTTVPTDHRMSITFTLAGIGSFSPPLGAFGR
jgi:lipopolysaccharide assembly outer membrane protein LptD (OstA)